MTRERSWCPYQLMEGSPSGLFEKDWIVMVKTRGEPIFSDAELKVPDEKPFCGKVTESGLVGRWKTRSCSSRSEHPDLFCPIFI